MGAPARSGSTRTEPHESPQEYEARLAMASLLKQSPIPDDELVDNLVLYVGRRQLGDVLAFDSLYRRILGTAGVVMEFGTRWGRHLGLLTALRARYEPYNVHRRIVGFDTFEGFPDVGDADQGSRHARPGGLSVTPGYQRHLDEVVAAHEAVDVLGHVQRTLTVAGDVRETLPQYLDENPQTVIALAYFDLDLYEPTRAVLESIRPYLTGGSLLAFDQVGHVKWPGETKALREVLGTDQVELELVEGSPTPVVMRWRPAARP